MWNLPTGKSFLSDISTRQLQNLYVVEQHPKSKLRLLAAVHRRKNESIDEIAGTLLKPRRTVHGWLTRFATQGINAKDARKQFGRPAQLTTKQKSQLINDLERGPPHNPTGLWTTKLVRDHLHRKYKVLFVNQHVWRMLNHLGFALLRPRKQHHNRASSEEIDRFKKKRADWCSNSGRKSS